MKKILILSALIMMAMAGVAQADPHLVCDPYQASDGVTRFELVLDGTTITSTPVANALYYDLATISVGSHTATLRACNSWGCSADTAPFVFTRPATLQPPKNFILAK